MELEYSIMNRENILEEIGWKENLTFILSNLRRNSSKHLTSIYIAKNGLNSIFFNLIQSFNNSRYCKIEFLNGFIIIENPHNLEDIIRTIHYQSSFNSDKQIVNNEEKIIPLMYEGFISKEKDNNQLIKILKQSFSKLYSDK